MILPGFPTTIPNQIASGVGFVNASGVIDSSGTGTATCSVPSGTFDGDKMIAVVTTSGASHSITTPSGWTSLFFANGVNFGDPTIRIVSRSANAEPATYSFSTNSPLVRAHIISLRGASSVSVGSLQRGFAVTAEAPTITIADRSYLLGIFAIQSSTADLSLPPAGMETLQGSAGSNPRMWAFGQVGVTGATGPRTITWTGSANNLGILLEVAV